MGVGEDTSSDVSKDNKQVIDHAVAAERASVFPVAHQHLASIPRNVVLFETGLNGSGDLIQDSILNQRLGVVAQCQELVGRI